MLPASAPATFHRTPASPRSANTDSSRSGHHSRHRCGLRSTAATAPGAANTPDLVLFSRRVGDTWSEVTAAQFVRQVTEVAKGLVAAGIQPGQRIGLLSKTRYEWTLIDYAIWTAGAVTVPI